ncbi:IS66 family transposase [Phytohabitans sp. ZYX-F-186]|uniref:IS66 family transposase n=1 Tax=Phytohabitans maris TaxID=3071409 RepID=A0ABU0ZRS7_9ACTN|nr:IS66 family transposase [Phytohabitans sp. ZYX-F-186]MDQ7909039.1 IS66 family transposase [Phytohabitans sp. ZYX-F-186]
MTARLDELTARVAGLESDNARLVAENIELRRENAVLQAENAELRRRSGLNSTNSSKPPSSDGLDKPPPASMRGRRGREPGKQPGGTGTALSQVRVPDEQVDHYPAACGDCGDGLDPVAGPAGDPVVRQVFDIPEVRVRVTAHLLHVLACAGCGSRTRAAAPHGVTGPAVYGPMVTMLAAYLAAQHHIPVARITEILADLAGIEVSVGWVTTACARMAAAVGPANEAIKDAIAAAPVAHFDETVTRVAGRNHWPHAAATGRLTAYHIDKHGRAAASMTAFGILPRFTGIAVHDAYSGYDGFTGCTHALCNAHILREATGISESPQRRKGGDVAAADHVLPDGRPVQESEPGTFRSVADGSLGRCEVISAEDARIEDRKQVRSLKVQNLRYLLRNGCQGPKAGRRRRVPDRRDHHARLDRRREGVRSPGSPREGRPPHDRRG